MTAGSPTNTAVSWTAAGTANLGLSVTVVICTYTNDRWHDLERACASALDQLGADDELVIVVDHNPELSGRARMLDRVRVLDSDAGPGLSGARNTGVRASGKDIVAFLDDDAVAQAGWLDSVRRAFVDPSTLAMGTSVTPAWDTGAAPRWFPEEFGWVVGCGYRGLPDDVADIRNPIGASMAIRRRVFAAAGGFVEDMGRIGVLPAGCEETEFCIRLAALFPGARVVYDPRSTVLHRVPVGRQTPKYFLRRCFFEGRSKRAVARLRGSSAGLAAERSYVRNVLPSGVLRGMGQALRRADPWALARATMISLGLGATVAGYVSAPRRSR